MPHGTRFITGRYKISVYREGGHGELFDLQEDPGEVRNLWQDPECGDLRATHLRQMAQGMLASEPMNMPRVAHA